MNKATGFVTFVIGVAIGSAATWYVTKTKYEKIAQEEIDSVKEYFSERSSKNEKPVDIPENKDESVDIKEYASKLSDNGYTNYSGAEESVLEEMHKIEKPYVIPPEEFGELDDYTKISLTYYADHILADDNDEFVEDVELTVGFDSLNHFGEYEDDSVFVRNDRLKIDYEILLNQRKYTDVVKKQPYLVAEV